ncbi:nuclear transport factor 2 family protein [Ruegeria arenilitoris]|uniref:nuclear transport factor 2 family protein n=1 Tax=Ruegeria arenilitoris TaxID=1173585 RepID=UPI0014813558|nr:nuclear transport factor 2 family protein [Ruegeria arenilitoris]
MKQLLALAAFLATPALAQDLPAAIDCYQTSTNAKDIEAYMGCFIEDAEMIDVSRSFEGQDAIRAWALREVIPSGSTFKHRKILKQSEGYAKTEVDWLSWVVHYSYWWDTDGKITRMSLQYAD